MSSDYYVHVAGEIADAGRDAALTEQLQSLASLRRYPAALACVEDFEREWRATMNDPQGRAALTITYRQAQADGEARGGVRCCGTTDEVHNPWCGYGPRRRREPALPVDDDEPGYPCCGGYHEHRYRCAARVWPATATPEVRRQAVRGDCIGPAHAMIDDLVRGGLGYQQRKRLTAILAGIWDDGHDYGAAHAGDGLIAEGTVRDD